VKPQKARAPAPRGITTEDQVHLDCDIVPPYLNFASRYVAAVGGTEAAALTVEKQVEQDTAVAHGCAYPAQVSGTIMDEAKEVYLVSVGA
jgi:hypothetical protein